MTRFYSGCLGGSTVDSWTFEKPSFVASSLGFRLVRRVRPAQMLVEIKP